MTNNYIWFYPQINHYALILPGTYEPLWKTALVLTSLPVIRLRSWCFLTWDSWIHLLFSHSVISDSLWTHDQQHTRIPYLSLSPGVCSKSSPLSQWCHPAISSSVSPFSTCSQSLPASGSFLMRQLLVSGGQSIGASASISDLPVNIQGWFPLGLTSLISFQSKGLSRVFSSINSSVLSLLYGQTLTSIHDYCKNNSLD